MINIENWKENYTHISNEAIDNEKVLRVIKSGKLMNMMKIRTLN
jgi:hypothetical protein